MTYPLPERTLLKDKAYEQLKCLIMEGKYPPGTFLTERHLAEVFEMSKAPVRSAIERLSAEGFLKVSPQQGIVIVGLSLEEILDHFELRIALESYVAEHLAKSLTVVQLGTINENLARQRRSAEMNDLESYWQLDTEFHVLLADFLGNQEISRVMRHQSEKLYRIITRIVDKQRPRMKTSTDEHAAIVAAIEAGSGARAAKLMQAHLEWGKSAVVSR